jgi:hypothetical protein
MRLDIELAEAARILPRRLAETERPHAGWRLDRFELGVLAVFAAASMWVLALDVWQVIAHGRVWTGTDGFYLVDQMQYLAWIREASHHVLASNLFVLRDTPADYFQPAVVISGVLAALGVPPWVALLLWKPVAVVGAFFAVRAYARRNLPGLWQRRIALVLGLFFGSFTVVYGSFSVVADLIPGFLSWGYTFGLIALAVMLGALLAYEEARAGKRPGWQPALLGALASALHPWQGELLILMVIGGELALARGGEELRRRSPLVTLTAVATAIPLAYYWVLGQSDRSWQLAREASRHEYSLLGILLAIVPLLVPALFAYRGRPRTFLAAATRAWPVAALVIYVLAITELSATPLHAFEGITVPLAVLAIEGCRRLGVKRLPRWRLATALAVLAATIPATVYELNSARSLAAPSYGNANFISSDEHRALRYLARDRTKGGVLTRFYLGSVIPAETGRRTFVGDCLWSQPRCGARAKIAQHLFDGTLAPAALRGIVQLSGARFVLADCELPGDVSRPLASMLVSVRHFGCATVYKLDAPPRPQGPLAESAAHAALRAPGRQQRPGQRS